MGTRKVLERARRQMVAAGVNAPPYRRSLIARLSREAAAAPDKARAAAAADAGGHFRVHGWSDASWDALGVSPRKRSGRPGGKFR